MKRHVHTHTHNVRRNYLAPLAEVLVMEMEQDVLHDSGLQDGYFQVSDPFSDNDDVEW